jgi:hypothetical protein
LELQFQEKIKYPLSRPYNVVQLCLVLFNWAYTVMSKFSPI